MDAFTVFLTFDWRMKKGRFVPNAVVNNQAHQTNILDF